MTKFKHWQKIIDGYRASGLTQKVFCQNHDIKIHTFHYWLKKLNPKPEAKEGFIAFQPVEEKGAADIKLDHTVITLSVGEVVFVLLELDQVGLLYDPA